VPNVHYENIGYSKIDGGVTAEIINLTITSTPITGTPDGFTEITITGTGFPKNLANFDSLTIGGTSVTPISVSNKEIKVITPARVGSNNNVNTVINYNGKTVTSTFFSYDDALRIEITALEFTSKGPTFKGTITITGTNFGTDKTKLTVILFNNNKNY
jgi:hypothetical protein